MKLREKIALWKQRRIFRKMQRCIDKILKYEPTIDGSLFSPAQLLALRDFHRYCEEFKTKFKVIRPYTSAELGFTFSNSYRLSNCESFFSKESQKEFYELHKVCSHSAGPDVKPVLFNVHLGVIWDEQRLESFKEDKFDE